MPVVGWCLDNRRAPGIVHPDILYAKTKDSQPHFVVNQEDNEKYVKAVTRKSKKTTKLRKTTNAWAVQLPPKHVKKIHMNFDEFHGFLSENYLLVQVCASIRVGCGSDSDVSHADLRVS